MTSGVGQRPRCTPRTLLCQPLPLYRKGSVVAPQFSPRTGGGRGQLGHSLPAGETRRGPRASLVRQTNSNLFQTRMSINIGIPDLPEGWSDRTYGNPVQLIQSASFRSKSGLANIQQARQDSLVIKGRQEVRDRCLANAEQLPDLSKRFKKKTMPYVSIMVVVDPNLGTPLGATFITTGMLWDGTPLLQSLLAEEFHKEELSDIAVRIQLHSDSVVWMEGASNAPNFTKWLDLSTATTISFHKAIPDKDNAGKVKVEKIQPEVSPRNEKHPFLPLTLCNLRWWQGPSSTTT